MSLAASHPVGFIVRWRRRAGARSALHLEGFLESIQAADIQTFGQYNTRWSAGYDAFTFGLAPSLHLLEHTLDRLERSEFAQLAQKEVFVGLAGSGEKVVDQGHLLTDQVDRFTGGNPEDPIGFYALWQRTDSYYQVPRQLLAAADQEITNVFDKARGAGIVTFGRYRCNWYCHWKFFTFWLAPSFTVLEEVFDNLEKVGDFRFARSVHRVGMLDR